MTITDAMKGKTRTRREQLRTAFDEYQDSSGLPKLPCNLCAIEGEPFECSSADDFLKHISDQHHEQLWESDKEQSDGEGDEKLPFEQGGLALGYHGVSRSSASN